MSALPQAGGDPVAPADPVRVASVLHTHVVITRVDPQWPPAASRYGSSGPVILEARIDEGGRVADVTKIIRGHPMLQEAAEAAVRQWTFEPLRLEGRAVPFVTTLVVPFASQPPVVVVGHRRTRRGRFTSRRAITSIDGVSMKRCGCCPRPTGSGVPTSRGPAGPTRTRKDTSTPESWKSWRGKGMPNGEAFATTPPSRIVTRRR
jgi:TonB family protein